MVYRANMGLYRNLPAKNSLRTGDEPLTLQRSTVFTPFGVFRMRCTMITQNDWTNDQETDNEQDQLDANLLEIEILYKSRCVKAPASGSNVTVREIEKSIE